MSAEQERHPPGAHAEARGNARIYQAAGDQHIDEHHYHYPPEALESLFGAVLARDAVPREPTPHTLTVPGPATVRTPLVATAPKVLRDRSTLMASLRRSVEDDHGRVHVLHGVGGSGKTTVAQSLFRELSRRGRRVGLWVNASDYGSFVAGMLAVAADRGATTVELAAAHGGYRAPADLVWHYLDASTQPWLLVLDNADDPEFIEAGGWLRDSPRGSVLVTTRRSDAAHWGEAELHEVGALPAADAAQVLCDLAPHAGDMEEAERTARRLDCLPLALTLAGSFLSRQTLEVWTMNDYRRHLEENPTELIDRGARPHRGGPQGRHLVSRTWTLSLEALSRQGRSESTTLLRLLSCWGADPLPIELLAPEAVADTGLFAARPPLGRDSVETALRGLLDQSLTSLVDLPHGAGRTRCLKTHGVVLDSVAAETAADQVSLLTKAAASLLERAISREVLPGRGAARMRMLAPHASRLLCRAAGGPAAGEAVRVAVRLAHEIHEAGDYTSAYSLARRAAEATAESGTEPAVVARARHAMAMAAFRLGRFAESEALHRDALAVRREILGEEHPETLESRQDLHLPLGQTGKMTECLRTLRDVAAVRTRLHGERHEETLRTRALLLEYLAVTGDLEQFDLLGRATVAGCEETLGPDAVTTVVAQHNWAFGCHTFGKPEAEQAARKALASRERIHGEDHALTLSATVLLSWILRDSGRLEESVRLARRVVAGQEVSLGRDHPYVLVNRKDLADSLARTGAQEEALVLAEDNLSLCEAALGADDPVTTATRRLVRELRS